MRKLYLLVAMLAIACCSKVMAQVSVTATVGTTGPTSYTTVNDAFAAINAGTHKGDIVITISANTTEPATPTPLLTSGTAGSSFNSVMIKPQGNVVVSSAATPTASRGVIELHGADNVTIDGDDPSTPGVRNLTVTVATTSNSSTAAVVLGSRSTTGADGATNIIIRNTVLIGGRNSATTTTTSYGIVFSNNASGSTISLNSHANNNITIANNEIKRAYVAISAAGGSATYPNANLIIRNNIIGSSIPAENAGNRGITLSNTATAAGATSAIVEGNDIQAGDPGTGFSSNVAGIELVGGNAGARINGNNIHDVAQPTSSGYGAWGIAITSATSSNDIVISNNIIRDMLGSNYTTTLTSQYLPYGIYISVAITNLSIIHNTIALTKTPTTGSASNSVSACINITSSTANISQFVNNILVNKISNSTNAYCIIVAGTGTNLASSTVNNNSYFTAPNGKVANMNAIGYAALSDWQVASNKDANSIYYDPVFVSNTNLHVKAGPSKLESAGTTTTITTDIDGQVRPGPAGSVNGGGTAPDIGADEFDGSALLATDISAMSLVTPTSTGCENDSAIVTMRVKNLGTNTIDFATNTLYVYANVTGGATASLVDSVKTGTLAPDSSLNVEVGDFAMMAQGVYNFTVIAKLVGDAAAANDTAYGTSTIGASVTLPQSVNFEGYNGSNLPTISAGWNEATGATTPVPGDAGWINRNWTSPVNTTAKVNLYTNTMSAWILGPKFIAQSNTRLRFDVAITNYNNFDPDPEGMVGTDDKVMVKVSTDCGATFQQVQVFDASNTAGISNTLVAQTVDLSAYAGMPVIVAFHATDGPVNDAPDYDFHIDNILIENATNNDLGATALVSPTAAVQCYSATETVTVTIKNFGLATQNFATTPVTVTTIVSGAVSDTLQATVNTGMLNADETLDVSMAGTLNMTAPGNYFFRSYTTFATDTTRANDTMALATRIGHVAIPEYVNFTGFTGSNLTAVFPNWYEAAGATTPAGTTSNWLSSTVWAGGNTSARVNLVGTSRNEWIVGPKIVVTPTTRFKFDIAITDNASASADPAGMQGTDDKVTVKISTDCGASFMDLQVYDASNTASISNSLVPQTLDLSAYAGQQVILAFHATDGPTDDAPSYDFHIDNIKIENATATDIGVVRIDQPVPGGCYSASEPVAVVIRNDGAAALNFATTPVTVTTMVTGALTTNLSVTLNSGTLAPLDTMTVLMSTQLNMTSPGNYVLRAYSTLTGDTIRANDTSSVITLKHYAALPEMVNFTGFTGANLTTLFPNWYEATGAAAPTGTTSAWTSATVWTNSNVSAKVNLLGATKNEWIVGPKIMATTGTRLKFDIAITDAASINADPAGMQGTDDKVYVKISTDCGVTFTDVTLYEATNTTNITNSLVQQIVDLSSYAGQQVIIAFLASEGTVDDAPSYDFHIDNIRIENASSVDAGILDIARPSAGSCYGANEQVRVIVRNEGSAPLNFATTPLTVTTEVTGAATANLTGTINTGTLAPLDTIGVMMTGVINMSASGTYNLTAYTTLAGDTVRSNDTIRTTRLVTPTVALPQSVNFTGYTGANLTALFPNWSEGAGTTVPSGTTSNWLQQTTWAGGNVTAKVNLYTTTRNEWIVGPKFQATTASRFRFDVAITDFASVNADPMGMQGTDDKVVLKISTDCGKSFQDLLVFDAANTVAITNTLVPQVVDLSAYAGQQVILAFFATDGPIDDSPDYDFHLDNLLIENAVSKDVGAIALVSPAVLTTTCYTATEQVVVTIKNMGVDPVNMATTPITVTTEVTGATTATLTAVVNSGALNPDETMDVTMSGTLNMTSPGAYRFKVYTTFAGDMVAVNDTMPIVTRTGTAALPERIDFTGFNGTNLTDVFPNWREASGDPSPTGTTSAWTQQTAWTPADTTIKYNLYLGGDNAWIVGPKVLAAANTVLKFNMALTDYNNTNPQDAGAGMAGTDDKLVVKISTDCGATYQDLFVYDASNTAGITNAQTPQSINLGAYAGQVIQIAFLASEGVSDAGHDYDVHLDDISIENETATPVSLVTFKGVRNGNNNLLSWTTANEVNNAGFELQRSADPDNFTTIAKVASKAINGNSSNELNYQYVDASPLQGDAYYRLKQLDKDGQVGYSQVIVIKAAKVSAIEFTNVYPNPATNRLNVKLSAPSASKVNVQVTDIAGRIVRAEAWTVNAGDNMFTLNISSLNAGVYTVKISSADGTTSVKKFVKQ